MARNANVDPIEKFRFRVTVMAVDLSLTGAVDTLANLAGQGSVLKNFRILSRLGFSDITLPKVTVSEIPYRENIDNLRFSKMPGLVRYEPIIMQRGVTSNRDLYDWLRLVNDELVLLSTAQELDRNAKFSAKQSENFRKDVVIEALDREGNPVKAWYLFNAWPTSYKPGNDLNASADEKLVEELTLTYELFLELEGGLAGFGKEILKNVGEGLIDHYSQQLPFMR